MILLFKNIFPEGFGLCYADERISILDEMTFPLVA